MERNVYSVVMGLDKMLYGDIQIKIDGTLGHHMGVYQMNTIPISVLGLEVFSFYVAWNDEKCYVEIIILEEVK